MTSPIWSSFLAVACEFALLVWGADRLVYGASASARNLGVSPLVIGLANESLSSLAGTGPLCFAGQLSHPGLGGQSISRMP